MSKMLRYYTVHSMKRASMMTTSPRIAFVDWARTPTGARLQSPQSAIARLCVLCIDDETGNAESGSSREQGRRAQQKQCAERLSSLSFVMDSEC
jgi:hypothetical protein